MLMRAFVMALLSLPGSIKLVAEPRSRKVTAWHNKNQLQIFLGLHSNIHMVLWIVIFHHQKLFYMFISPIWMEESNVLKKKSERKWNEIKVQSWKLRRLLGDGKQSKFKTSLKLETRQSSDSGLVGTLKKKKILTKMMWDWFLYRFFGSNSS